MKPEPVKEKSILLVEDNPDDEDLTIRALRKNGIFNELTVARDGGVVLTSSREEQDIFKSSSLHVTSGGV